MLTTDKKTLIKLLKAHTHIARKARSSLQCLYISHGTIAATDGHRLLCTQLGSEKSEEGECLLLAADVCRLIGALQAHDGDTVTLSTIDGFFALDGTPVCIRVGDAGDYPKWRHVVPGDARAPEAADWGCDLTLLADVGKALVLCDKADTVVVNSAGSLDPITFTYTGDACAQKYVLMPKRYR